MEMTPANKLLGLSGKTAIITGAVGIGFGIAYRLAEAGANLVLAARSKQEADASTGKLSEFAPHKIWVNAIAPGGVMTPGVQKLQQSMPTPQGVDMSNMMEGFFGKNSNAPNGGAG